MQGTGTVEVRVDMKKIKTMQIAGVLFFVALVILAVEADCPGARC